MRCKYRASFSFGQTFRIFFSQTLLKGGRIFHERRADIFLNAGGHLLQADRFSCKKRAAISGRTDWNNYKSVK